MENQFDYIVIGAGSSGCVVANRLSADPSVRVLLMEAGDEPRSPWITIPAGMGKLHTPGRFNWGYYTEPEPHLNNRKVYWPRGRGLGGSSAINGMIYLRGHRLDFEHWRQLGNEGWGWDDVLPIFRRSAGQNPDGTLDPAIVGKVALSEPDSRHPFSELFIDAAKSCGFDARDDFNSGEHDGVGYLQLNIRKGFRVSAHDAFITPVRNRPNLTVLTCAQSERILIQDGRATGVVYRHGGLTKTVLARHEVILSGGAINSPQILMLSGIGPGAALSALGIDVLSDLPGVGKNLQDHVHAPVVYRGPDRYSVNRRLHLPRLLREVAHYALNRRGLLAMGSSQTCLYARVMDGVEQPDIQITTRPFSFTYEKGRIVPARQSAVTISVALLRPQSRGQLTLRSNDIADAPIIKANYFEAGADRVTTMAGLRLVERIMSTPAMSEFHAANPLPEDDDGLLERLCGFAGSVMHPVGTCCMGTGQDAVVDSRLRVRGITGLRVADASIMPAIVSANTHAATTMIGEKAAAMIIADRHGTSSGSRQRQGSV